MNVGWLAHRAEILPFGYYAAILSLVVVSYVQAGKSPGYDAWLYREASAAWVSGMDPWSVGVSGAHFAGTPATVLVYLPTVLIPADLWRSLSVFVNLVAAVFILRQVKLGLYWLIYVPLAVAVILGQPGVLVLALLVSPLAAGAPLIKAFAGLPLLWRPRDCILAMALGLATVFVASGLWRQWIERVPELSARLALELHGVEPLGMLILGGISLIVIVRRRPDHAPWLAVSALWPIPEYHYAIFALPTRLPWLLLAMALQPGPLPVVAYAAWILAVDWAGVHRPKLARAVDQMGPHSQS